MVVMFITLHEESILGGFEYSQEGFHYVLLFFFFFKFFRLDIGYYIMLSVA